MDSVPDLQLKSSRPKEGAAKIRIKLKPQLKNAPTMLQKIGDFVDGPKHNLGFQPGQELRLPVPWGYEIIDDIPGLERKEANIFKVTKYIEPNIPLEYSAIEVDKSFPDNNVDLIPEDQFTKEEQTIRAMMREALRQDPENVENLISFINLFYIGGAKTVDEKDNFTGRSFIYLLAQDGSNMQFLLRQMSLDELREMKLGQCELFSAFCARLLNGILPSAVAMGVLNVNHDPKLFTSDGLHARLLVQDLQKKSHLVEVTNPFFVRQKADMSVKERNDLLVILKQIRSTKDAEEKEKLISQFRNNLLIYTQ